MAEETGTPAGYGYSYADMAGGYTGALAALIALCHQRRTGQGQFVDSRSSRRSSAVVGPSLLDIAVNEREQPPPLYNSQEGPAAPHGVYRCRRSAMMTIDGSRFSSLARRMGAVGESDRRAGVDLGREVPDALLADEKHAELDAHLSRWTRERSAEDAMMILQRAKVAAGIVENGADICARDPQLKERDFWPAVSTNKGATTHVTGIPFKLSGGSGEISRIAPEVGEDFDYVLGELLGLGKSARDEELVAEGAVWP